MSSYLDPFSNVSKAELGCPSRPPFVIRGPGVAAFINTPTPARWALAISSRVFAIGRVGFSPRFAPFEGLPSRAG